MAQPPLLGLPPGRDVRIVPLVSAVVERLHSVLQDSVMQALRTPASADATRRLLRAVHGAAETVARLIVIVRWASTERTDRGSKLATDALKVATSLSRKALAGRQIADDLFFFSMSPELHLARRPPLVLNAAIDVLCSGSGSSLSSVAAHRLPISITDGMAGGALLRARQQANGAAEASSATAVATAAERKSQLARIVRVRVLEEMAGKGVHCMSPPFDSIRINDGRVQLRCSGEFECTLGLRSARDGGWIAEKLKLLVGSGSLDADQLLFAGQQLLHLLQRRLDTPITAADEVEPRNTFEEVYTLCHAYCQSVQFLMLEEQVRNLRKAGSSLVKGLGWESSAGVVDSQEVTKVTLTFYGAASDRDATPTITIASFRGDAAVRVECSPHFGPDGDWLEDVKLAISNINASSLLQNVIHRLAEQKLEVVANACNSCVDLSESWPFVDFPLAGFSSVGKEPSVRIQVDISTGSFKAELDGFNMKMERATPAGSSFAERRRTAAWDLIVADARQVLNQLANHCGRLSAGAFEAGKEPKLVQNSNEMTKFTSVLTRRLFLLRVCDLLRLPQCTLFGVTKAVSPVYSWKFSEEFDSASRNLPNSVPRLLLLLDDMPVQTIEKAASIESLFRPPAPSLVEQRGERYGLFIAISLANEDNVCVFELVAARTEDAPLSITHVDFLYSAPLSAESENMNSPKRARLDDGATDYVAGMLHKVLDCVRSRVLSFAIRVALRVSGTNFTKSEPVPGSGSPVKRPRIDSEPSQFVVEIDAATNEMPLRAQRVVFDVFPDTASWTVSVDLADPIVDMPGSVVPNDPHDRVSLRQPARTVSNVSSSGENQIERITFSYHAGSVRTGSRAAVPRDQLEKLAEDSILVQFEHDLEQTRVISLLQDQFLTWGPLKGKDNSWGKEVLDGGSTVQVEVLAWAVDMIQLCVSSTGGLRACLQLSTRRPRFEQLSGLFSSTASGLHVAVAQVPDITFFSRELVRRFRPHLELVLAKNQAFVDTANAFSLQRHDLLGFAIFASRLLRVLAAEHILIEVAAKNGMPSPAGSVVVRSLTQFRFKVGPVVRGSVDAGATLDIDFGEDPSTALLLTAQMNEPSGSTGNVPCFAETVSKLLLGGQPRSETSPFRDVECIATAMAFTRHIFVLARIHQFIAEAGGSTQEKQIQAMTGRARCTVSLPYNVHVCFDVEEPTSDLSRPMRTFFYSNVTFWRDGPTQDTVRCKEVKKFFKRAFVPSAVARFGGTKETTAMINACKILVLPLESELIDMMGPFLKDGRSFTPVLDLWTIAPRECTVIIDFQINSGPLLARYPKAEGGLRVEFVRALPGDGRGSSLTVSRVFTVSQRSGRNEEVVSEIQAAVRTACDSVSAGEGSLVDLLENLSRHLLES